jgi:hypothetical protein
MEWDGSATLKNLDENGYGFLEFLRTCTASEGLIECFEERNESRRSLTLNRVTGEGTIKSEFGDPSARKHLTGSYVCEKSEQKRLF